MKINKIIYICIFSILMFLNLNYINAGSNVENSVDESTLIVNESTYETINKVIFMISEKLREIDFKLDKARITEEYEKYPLIRLSIDSPYFGLSNIVESKLKIKNQVSTLDMAKGYNLRSMINSKNILVEDMEVTSFVVTTRKIKISENMTQHDAILCLNKLFQYLNQVEETSNFLDIELRNIFGDYFSNNKNMNVVYIKNEIKTMESTLKNLQDIIMKENLITSNDVSEKLEKCNEYYLKIQEFKSIINNPLVDNELLEQEIYNAIICKNELLEFYKNVSNENLGDNKNIDLNMLLKNSLIHMDNDIIFIKELINYDEQNIENEESNYSNFFNKYLTSIQKYRDELSDALMQGKYNKQEQYSDQQIDIEFSKIYDIYLKFLNSYNIALTQYIKLQVTQLKENGIIDIGINEDIIYLYSTIDNELLDIANAYDKNDVYSNVKSTKRLTDIASKLCQINLNMLGE